MPFPAAYKNHFETNRNIDGNYYFQIAGISTIYSKKEIPAIVTAGFGLQPFGTSAFGGSSAALPSKPFIEKSAWNPGRIQLDNVRTSVETIAITLTDPDGSFLTDISSIDPYLKILSLFMGDTALPDTAYHKVREFRILEIIAGDEVYTIKAENNMGELRAPIKIPATILTADLAAGATTATVSDTSTFATTGSGRIDSEVITWTGKSATTLTGLTRGVDGSDDDDHKAGADVFEIQTLQENPITAMLQLLISPGGGGIYDVLTYGLGISQTRIDVARFESIRDDSNLVNDVYKFEFDTHINDALTFFEDEIMTFTTTRIVMNDDAQLSLALLDVTIIDDIADDLEKVDITNVPVCSTDARRLENRVFSKWDLKLGTEEYLKSETHDDNASQTKWGVQIGRTFTSNGIKLSLNGQVIIDRFIGRIQRRLSEPATRLAKVRVLAKKQFFLPGQKSIITHDKVVDLPNGVKGIARTGEFLNKKIDLDDFIVEYDVNFSLNLSNRYGYIGPASGVASGASTTVFTLLAGEGVKWNVGEEIALYTTLGVLVDTSVITIISTDTITVAPALSFTPSTTHVMKYDDFDNISETTVKQRLFGFVGATGGGNFGDGSPPFVISG